MDILADILFINPLKLPDGARLFMFFPLALCVALVYRATREHDLSRLFRRSVITFVNIVVGMILIAVAAYGIHEAVLRFG
ncbi:MAG: hypothetical protein U1D55_03560 [Phycisphaerae bacterium]